MDLWSKTQTVSSQAISSGAQQPIPTFSETVYEGDYNYLLRTLDNLQRKDNALRMQQTGDNNHNPFMPYDPDLFVCELGNQHICLLNKFNVVKHHLLLVTRSFHPQSELLSRSDFNAAALCLAEANGLIFYNGGTEAGASQLHKHLQLVPLKSATALPLATQLDHFSDTCSTNSNLPFHQAGIRVPDRLFDDPERAAHWLNNHYSELLSLLNIDIAGSTVITPYNLLLTRRWLMLVPRCLESVSGISFNALAFCGAILVRTDDQAEELKTMGIGKTLRSVTVKADRGYAAS